MQIYTSNGRIIMKDGKIGIGPDCCSLTCDAYGSSGGGSGCNDDIMGICCVPGTGGTCGEATQCDCDAAGGTWRFAEVDGREVAPGVIDKCSPSGMGGFLDENGNAYTVCACDVASNITVVWRDIQAHPDYNPASGDPPPMVACNRCRSFVDIGEFEELAVTNGLFVLSGTGDRGLVLCGEHDCYDNTRDPLWIWGDPAGPDPSLMPGTSDIYGRNCTSLLPDSAIPACRDLDDDGVDDNGTGDPATPNPCYDQTDPAYSSCDCSSPYYVGFASGVWSNSTTWDPCVAYGYDGLNPCC